MAIFPAMISITCCFIVWTSTTKSEAEPANRRTRPGLRTSISRLETQVQMPICSCYVIQFKPIVVSCRKRRASVTLLLSPLRRVCNSFSCQPSRSVSSPTPESRDHARPWRHSSVRPHAAGIVAEGLLKWGFFADEAAIKSPSAGSRSVWRTE